MSDIERQAFVDAVMNHMRAFVNRSVGQMLRRSRERAERAAKL